MCSLFFFCSHGPDTVYCLSKSKMPFRIFASKSIILTFFIKNDIILYIKKKGGNKVISTLYDKFKPWSAKGSVYIISDTHFADLDCKLMDINWITPEEQVKRINHYVSKNDTLIILGDVGDKAYASQLRGYKVLISGNHDTGPFKKYGDIFDEIYTGPLFISEKILLSHEPIYGLNFCLNIHGHDHNIYNTGDDYHINLAANVCGYEPKNLNKIIKEGKLSKINTIHRETIDNATKRKEVKPNGINA